MTPVIQPSRSLVETGKFHLGLFTSDDNGWDFVEESYKWFWKEMLMEVILYMILFWNTSYNLYIIDK